MKTTGRERSGGSNPSPSDFHEIISDLNKALLALGMARGLLYKFTRPLPSIMDEETMAKIDQLIGEVCYGVKPKKENKSKEVRP